MALPSLAALPLAHPTGYWGEELRRKYGGEKWLFESEVENVHVVRDRRKEAGDDDNKLAIVAADDNSYLLYMKLRRIMKKEPEKEYLKYAKDFAVRMKTSRDAWERYVMALEEYQARYLLELSRNSTEEQLRSCAVDKYMLLFAHERERQLLRQAGVAV